MSMKILFTFAKPLFLAWEKYFDADLYVSCPQHFLRNIVSFSEAQVSEN